MGDEKQQETGWDYRDTLRGLMRKHGTDVDDHGDCEGCQWAECVSKLLEANERQALIRIELESRDWRTAAHRLRAECFVTHAELREVADSYDARIEAEVQKRKRAERALREIEQDADRMNNWTMAGDFRRLFLDFVSRCLTTAREALEANDG